ncbi:hypothetical protein Tco_0087116 [Tanacetum coccineum]
MQTIHDAQEPATMPYDSSQPRKVEDLQNGLKQTKLTYGAAYTKLILRVKKLEHKGRIIVEIDQNPSISLVQDEGTSWIQEDAETQGRTSADTEILLEQEEPTELVEDPGSGEKGEKEISTAERKDKGKAIMKDDESVQKKTKKQLEQERLGHEEAIRLQEQINEEERQRIARDAEIAKQLQEEIDIARQEQEKYDLAQALELQKELDKRKEGVAETTQAHDIDWSDPAVLRYHAQQNRSFSKAEVRKNMCMYLKNQGGYKQSHFKGMSYEDIRPIFERVWDQNQSFVPKDSEIEKEVMKRSGFDFQKPPAKRQKIGEVSESVEEQSAGKEKEVSEEELKKLLVIVPVEEVYIEALQVKYPIIDWEVFTEESRSRKTKGYDLMLWGDLKTLFEPNEEDEVWRNQHGYNLISWRLIDSCGIHILLMDNGIAIHMMVEKKYPLIQEMLSKMLNRKLEIDHESEMAFELLRFTRSQLQK